jgi:1,2-diacylglycerol 3-beta-glucosyltransferase
VASLLATDYPEDLRRVVVVADNCSDETARVAEAAGATVVVRVDPERRGKGYALALAFDRALSEGTVDALAVVDADTLVSSTFLRACAARVAEGADAVQVSYGVRNPDASWRTRLLAIAFTLVHDVRSLGRERLRLSAGLRGNGMCFTTRILREVPYRSFSLVEDVEYGIQLGLAGHRVQFASEAWVRGEMPAGAEAARSQRRRWEGGRLQMARAHALPLLRRGLVEHDRVLVDLALDLLLPPLGYLGGAAVVGLLAACVVSGVRGDWGLPAPWLWAASVAAIALHVARGWWLSGTGVAGLGALARAPIYVLWKVGLALTGSSRRRDEWVRTSRERP